MIKIWTKNSYKEIYFLNFMPSIVEPCPQILTSPKVCCGTVREMDTLQSTFAAAAVATVG